MVHTLAIAQTVFKLSYGVLEVLGLQVKFLSAHGAILLVPGDSVLKQSFLRLHYLHQFLGLTA